MPTGSSVYTGSYIKAEYLRDNHGGEWTLTVADGSEITRFDDGTTQVVLQFEETDLHLGLNKTNFNRIAELLNEPNSDNWAGASVTIYDDPNVMYGGKRIGGVRVKAASFANAAPASVTDVLDNPGDVCMGDDGKERVLQFCKSKAVDLDSLRAKLVQDGVLTSGQAGLGIEVWPKSIGAQVKSAIEALSDDIPF